MQTGIQTYGVVFTPNYGYVYAYEVDGLNHANLMDDANIPSLLSAPYIGYTKADELHLRQYAAVFALQGQSDVLQRQAGPAGSVRRTPTTAGSGRWRC